MTTKAKPEMNRLNLDDVNPLALSAARMFDEMPPRELAKLDQEFAQQFTHVRNNAAGFKKLACLIGFMYVQAIKEARDERLAKLQPLPNQKELFTERTPV